MKVQRKMIPAMIAARHVPMKIAAALCVFTGKSQMVGILLSYRGCMNTITRIAAVLTLAAVVGTPLAAQAQFGGAPQPAATSMGEHHHGRRMRDSFIRAVHK